MDKIRVRPAGGQDRTWVEATLKKHWGSAEIVTRGRLHQADRLPGFIAWLGKQRIGLATYRLAGDECEITSLNSEVERIGAGTALIGRVRAAAAGAGCRRLWLITTNDNLAALRFYQKRGFTLAAVYPDALVDSRRLKPGISKIGLDGIPLRDEIELELLLQP